jgi:hypothetical protein
MAYSGWITHLGKPTGRSREFTNGPGTLLLLWDYYRPTGRQQRFVTNQYAAPKDKSLRTLETGKIRLFILASVARALQSAQFNPCCPRVKKSQLASLQARSFLQTAARILRLVHFFLAFIP